MRRVLIVESLNDLFFRIVNRRTPSDVSAGVLRLRQPRRDQFCSITVVCGIDRTAGQTRVCPLWREAIVERRPVATQNCGSRNNRQSGCDSGIAFFRPLISEKEKQFVLQERPAGCASELVAFELSL